MTAAKVNATAISACDGERTAQAAQHRKAAAICNIDDK